MSKKSEKLEVTYSEVAELLATKNIVAIYQGRTEAGPRALGNRSILYDPRDPDSRDYVNSVKQREYWRPFAATVMLEHVHDWFDMATLKESSYMMYAVPVREDKKDLIPGVIHVDGTCRIQTVTEDQNYHYYNLIKSFYEITSIPLVFNTSFNLGGEVICHTLFDAYTTLDNSSIEYLYLPEEKKLIVSEN
jgi:carbamoyltransferase